MTARTFIAPWDGNTRLPAAFLERHAARCRVLEKPDATPPQTVAEALAASEHETQERAATLANTCEQALLHYFTLAPPEYDADAAPLNVTEALSGKCDHLALFGGRGGGKSHVAAEAIIELCSTRKERVAGAREYMTRIKESSKELLEQKVNESRYASDWEITEYELKNTKTGSVIFFIGLNGQNSASVAKSLEGITILWSDESQFLSQGSIDVLLPTIRGTGSRFVWTWNPAEDASPVDNLFRKGEPPERSIIRCLLVEDNPYLYCTRLAAEMRSAYKRDSPEKFGYVWRGLHYESSETRIFPVAQIHVGYFKVPPASQPLFGMDFGYSADPNTLLRAYYWTPQALLLDPEENRPVIYVEAEAYEHKTELVDLGTFVGKVHGAGHSGTIKADSSRPDLISELNRLTFNTVGSYKPSGSIKLGLEFIRGCTLVISPQCPNTLREVKAARYQTDKLGKVHSNGLLDTKASDGDHILDGLRYLLEDVIYPDRESEGNSTTVTVERPIRHGRNRSA